jgi:hypothetical protein
MATRAKAKTVASDALSAGGDPTSAPESVPGAEAPLEPIEIGSYVVMSVTDWRGQFVTAGYVTAIDDDGNVTAVAAAPESSVVGWERVR